MLGGAIAVTKKATFAGSLRNTRPADKGWNHKEVAGALSPGPIGSFSWSLLVKKTHSFCAAEVPVLFLLLLAFWRIR